MQSVPRGLFGLMIGNDIRKRVKSKRSRQSEKKSLFENPLRQFIFHKVSREH